MNYDIHRDDVLKAIYFITALTQNQGTNSMQGALSSKGDLMGGIFDRWINIVPESVIFNKVILPKISQNKKVEVISDFYLYDPRIAGIAPDVIGIRINGTAIPFVVYDKKWTPQKNMPQIEVKTFKRNQKMITLRDQGYSSKYLVMAETEFRIDYLLPFFDASIYSDLIYNQMKMDDTVFIKENNGDIREITKINMDNDILGTVSLLKITDAQTFMNCSNLCKGGVSPHYITNISQGRLTGQLIDIPLSDYCSLNSHGFYEFNSQWYSEMKIIFGEKKILSLNFHSSDISSIKVRKINKSSIYIISEVDTFINDIEISANTPYKLDFQLLDREGNSGEEYFFLKSAVSHIPDTEKRLLDSLSKIIKNH